MPLAIAAAAVVLGLGVWYTVGTAPNAGPSASVTAAQGDRVLQLSRADINWQATRMAQEMIRTGRVKPAPAVPGPGATPQGAGSVPPGDDPASRTAPPTASAPQPASPAPAAPVVYPAKRPPPPVAAAPAPAPAATPSAPDPADPTRAPPVMDAPPVEVEQAVVALVEQAPEPTRQDILSGRQVIYTLHVTDNMFDDGDQVTVTVPGSFGPVTVTLTNRGQDLLIPLIAGVASTVNVSAAFDGGGGVTFGAYSSLGETRSRVMAVGQSDTWTVVTQ